MDASWSPASFSREVALLNATSWHWSLLCWPPWPGLRLCSLCCLWDLSPWPCIPVAFAAVVRVLTTMWLITTLSIAAGPVSGLVLWPCRQGPPEVATWFLTGSPQVSHRELGLWLCCALPNTPCGQSSRPPPGCTGRRPGCPCVSRLHDRPRASLAF